MTGGKDGVVCIWDESFKTCVKSYPVTNANLAEGSSGRLLEDSPTVRAIYLGKYRVLSKFTSGRQNLHRGVKIYIWASKFTSGRQNLHLGVKIYIGASKFTSGRQNLHRGATGGCFCYHRPLAFAPDFDYQTSFINLDALSTCSSCARITTSGKVSVTIVAPIVVCGWAIEAQRTHF